MNLTPEQLAKITDPNHPIFQVMERITAIEQRLTTNDPEISTHLKVVLKQLQEYEELAHLLTPEQVGILMKGYQKHTGIHLVVEKPTKTSTRGKKPTVEDLL